MLNLSTRILIAAAEAELTKSAETAVQEQPQLSTVGQQQAQTGDDELARMLQAVSAEKAQNKALFAKLFEHGRTGNYITRSFAVRPAK